MKSLQLIAAEALRADTVFIFMQESNELNKTKFDNAIKSVRAQVPNLPPFPDYFNTIHCWKAIKDFTEPQINEIFFSTQLCLMLGDIKNLSTQEDIIRINQGHVHILLYGRPQAHNKNGRRMHQGRRQPGAPLFFLRKLGME
jgi:hypothetical protein